MKAPLLTLQDISAIIIYNICIVILESNRQKEGTIHVNL